MSLIVFDMPGHRQTLRLPDVDYGRSGLYFVSMVTENREPLLGKIINQAVELSPAGEIVNEEWLKTPIIRPGVALDEWQIMPDHFHFIVNIDSETHQDKTKGREGAHSSAPYPLMRQPRSLGSMIGQFKSITTHRINELRSTPGQKVWQRNYDERIIRNEFELDKIRKHIRTNPERTKGDEHGNPHR